MKFDFIHSELKTFLRIFLTILLISNLFSCKSSKINNLSDEGIEFIFTKTDIEISSDKFESPLYHFDVKIISKTSDSRIKEIDEEVFDYRFKFEQERKISFEDTIESIAKAIKLKNEIPFVIVENENNELKYLFNYLPFNDPIKTTINDFEAILSGPIRQMFFIQRFLYKRKNIRLKKGIPEDLGEFEIYQYDLKINPADKKVKLHYVENNRVISSSWISIDDKSERIENLLYY